MLHYFDGQPVHIGDVVDFDGEPGTVIEILDVEKDFAAAGMIAPAVGFSTDSIAAVYQSPADRGWESVALVRRQT